MTEFNELDYLFDLNSDGIQQYSGGDGMNNRIMEWLATPEGTVADDPEWGHPLRPFQFDPTGGSDLEVSVQLAVVRKIRLDINDIIVKSIAVETSDIDSMIIYINHNYGEFLETISINNEASNRGII